VLDQSINWPRNRTHQGLAGSSHLGVQDSSVLASIRDSFKWSKAILAALGAWAMTRIQSILGALERNTPNYQALRPHLFRDDPETQCSDRFYLGVFAAWDCASRMEGEYSQRDTLFWNKSRGRLGRMLIPLLIGCILIEWVAPPCQLLPQEQLTLRLFCLRFWATATLALSLSATQNEIVT
jgi:hypothetical protein